jgi:hypothetical protein
LPTLTPASTMVAAGLPPPLKELTASGGDVRFGERREVWLKGLPGSHGLFEVGW